MTQFNPKSIVEKNIPENIEGAEAHLYEFENLKIGKKYVGVHKGQPLVNYYFSSNDEQLLEDFSDSNAQFKYTVLDYGTYPNVLAKETSILKSVNAKDNNNYYNKSNGYADDSIVIDPEKMNEYAQEILNHRRITFEDIIIERCKVKKQVLKGLKKLQTRRQTLFHNHKQRLQQKIMDNGGNTEHLTIVVLEKRNNGEDLIIGGNHSDSAIQSCKKATHAYVIYIPLEIHKHWSDLNVKQLSGFLNPRAENPALESHNDDIEDMVVDLLEKGYNVNSSEVVAIYNIYFLNTADRATISRKAKARIKNQELANLNWINYKAEPDSHLLDKKVNIENAKQGVYCKAYSTGKIDYWRDIVQIRKRNKAFIENKQLDKLIKIYKVFLWHPSQKAETDHFQLYAADDKEIMNWVLNRNNNDTKDTNISPVQIVVEYMPSQRIKEVS